MRINHNIAALNTYRQLSVNNGSGAKSLEKLSSGLRINRAGDDAAGLAISEKMRAQIKGLNMASKNSQDAISLVQTAEGALGETQSILQRMRELAVQSANDTNVSVDREQIQKEINQLTSEINRIGNSTEFNTMTLLNGDLSKTAATTEDVLAAGTKEVKFAAKVTASSTVAFQRAVGEIEVEAGEFFDSIGTSVSTISLTYSSGTITVQLQGASALGSATLFQATDQITLNADGGFTYNDHGVSFTITKAQADKLTEGSTLALGNITAVGSFGTETTYAFGKSSAGTTIGAFVSDITVVADNDNKAVRSVQFQTVSNSVTVTLTDTGSGGGTALFTDVIAMSGANSLYTYNNHGISFTIDMTTMTADNTVSGIISLTGLGTTENTLTYDDNSLKFQVGANENQTLALDISDMRAKALSISSATGGGAFTSTKVVSDGTTNTNSEYALDLTTSTKAAGAITLINSAITGVSEERSKLGAVQNRLEHTINNLDASAENLQASESRIRDVDMAKEMMEFTKNNILTQAAQSMLAQANQQPQGVLQLLR
jgi:flagellin